MIWWTSGGTPGMSLMVSLMCLTGLTASLILFQNNCCCCCCYQLERCLKMSLDMSSPLLTPSKIGCPYWSYDCWWMFYQAFSTCGTALVICPTIWFPTLPTWFPNFLASLTRSLNENISCICCCWLNGRSGR